MKAVGFSILNGSKCSPAAPGVRGRPDRKIRFDAKAGGTEAVGSVLDPTLPVDVGVLSQRQRIIDGMVESCAEKTYAATTIADIVSRASISRTTFYKRFSGKRECFDAALDWCLEELKAAATGSCSASYSPAEAVRTAVAAMLDLMAARPALAQLAMGEATFVEADASRRYLRILIPALENLWDTTGEPRHSGADPRLSLGRAQVLVYNQVLAGRTEQLPELLPELVYLALLPFAGHEEALRQARLAGSDIAPRPR
jgi:AcrR family transcriptional regulator